MPFPYSKPKLQCKASQPHGASCSLLLAAMDVRSLQFVSQRLEFPIPANQVVERVGGVRRAWVRHKKGFGYPDDALLKPQAWPLVDSFSVLEVVSIPCRAVKAHDERLKAFELLLEHGHPLSEIGGSQVGRTAARALHHVRKSYALLKHPVVCVSVERLGEQTGAIDGRPEPVPRVREVVPHFNRGQPRVKPDEYDIQPWREVVWKRFHDASTATASLGALSGIALAER